MSTSCNLISKVSPLGQSNHVNQTYFVRKVWLLFSPNFIFSTYTVCVYMFQK